MLELFGVSKYILVTIFTQWISRDDVLNLDTACCNRKHRAVLLAVLGTFPEHLRRCLYPSDSVLLTDRMLKWLLVRGIRCSLQSVALTRKSIPKSVDSVSSVFNAISLASRVTLEYLTEIHLPVLYEYYSSFLKVTSLRLRRFSCANEVLTTITCTQLTSLDISHCSSISMECLIQLCRMNPSLLYFSYRATCQINLLICLAVHCRQIQSVCISNCARSSMFLLHCASGLSRFESFSVNRILLSYYHGENLASLVVKEAQYGSLPTLSELCPNLVQLSMSVRRHSLNVLDSLPGTLTDVTCESGIMSDEQLQLIGENCKGIIKLNLSFPTRGLYRFNRFPNLIELAIGVANDELLDSIALHCKNLQTLKINHIPRELSSVIVIWQCTRLTSLVMNNVCKPEVLSEIAEYGTGLTSLRIECNLARDSETVLSPLLDQFRNLTTLHFCWPTYDKLLLPNIAEYCKNLTELSLLGTANDFDVLKEMLAKMPRLQVIKVAVADHSKELELQELRPDVYFN